MAEARDIVKGALRKIAVLGTGSPLDATEAQDALELLNGMLSSWSVEGNLVYTETIETFNLVSGTGSYTIGASGDFNTARPIDIRYMTVKQGNTDYSLYPMSQEQYAKISQKTITTEPDSFYYDAGYPLGTIRFYPVPDGDSVDIYSVKSLESFASLGTTFAMPEEYRLALEYNLAEMLAPEYEREASPTVRRMAKRTKNAVEAQNSRNDKNLSPLDVPSTGSGGHFNIYNTGSR